MTPSRLPTLLSLLLAPLALFAQEEEAKKPNFVIIFCDDLGYGDLGCYGNPTIATPHLDRMAGEGLKFTQFYSAASVCTPSRAAILTGRLPVRSGMCSDRRRVLFPDSALGLPESEVTLAEALKELGYATAAVGKWHLGHLPRYLPTNNGFDSYFGIPYSNDMERVVRGISGRQANFEPKVEYFNVPLMRDEEIIERPADQRTITKRYAEEAVKFIKQSKDKPFFLYLAHSMPHVPLFASDDFRDKSLRGRYGDVIEEIDWSAGQVMQALKEEGLEDNTIVFFTSDNGPWLIFNEIGGSAGPLRMGKGSTWDGGMREPAIAWGPGLIPGGRTTAELGSTMDLFTTFIGLAGGKVPEDRVIDGEDLGPVLFGKGKSRRDSVLFYRGEQLWAVRRGPWKAHFKTRPGYGGNPVEVHNPPLLYNLEIDPGEQWNVAEANPRVLEEIQKVVDAHNGELVRGEVQLDKRAE